MHTKPMSESEGSFSDKKIVECYCIRCKKKTPHYKMLWKSHCGGYEDEKYICTECKYQIWVEGPDA
jgi:hypothetical protein